MPRKLRLEYPGACYHVINRGNYRAHIFQTAGARQAFEACLFEACQKSGWVLHAYVLMSNHYHLALETPEGNLVAGMQWLQATYANRFNKLRGERGHLFQGRYKSLLVEPGSALGQVCHYLHLNPVRAGVTTVAKLGDYRDSSYWYLNRPKQRPGFLHPETVLAEAGGIADTPAGRRSYADYLAWQMAEGAAGRNKAYVSLSRGWALGTKDFKAALAKDHVLAADSRAWEKAGSREIRELRWAPALEKCLKTLNKDTAAIRAEPKSAPWKAAIALRLKEATQADNRWLATQLHMGRPEAVSSYVARLRAGEPSGKRAFVKLTPIVLT